MGMNEILTVKEVALLLKTTRQQVRKMIQNGELPAVKVGREWRVPYNLIETFFSENLA
ncbi:helix-turn-helix domain-containing protein [Butyricicoccus faecihominis]|uniref:helix-turn-helix domain-containing protein n=1 Tax=Butyricicoccus faecihominis TaxID=1712515 RepID=UPI0024788FCC|nr:helix-turn-helix domain-containing protein [Butyricicoccus faecihominis]MCQ5128037.1 helix-turn-helix domain-containing protein [Butyricicoccus faecihominis]